jgi:hypothetical protein
MSLCDIDRAPRSRNKHKMLIVRLSLLVLLLLLSGCGQPHDADADDIQFEIDCLAWQHETPRQQYLDGPEFPRPVCALFEESQPKTNRGG